MSNPRLQPVLFNIGTKHAINSIKEEASGKQLGMYSRYEPFNRIFTKYFRYDRILLIGGNSSGGKSYLKSKLKLDFTDTQDLILPIDKTKTKLIEQLTTIGEFYLDGDNLVKPSINSKYHKPVLFIDFSFEMSIESEMHRLISIYTGYNTEYLKSSLMINGRYETIKDESVEFIESLLTGLTKQKQHSIITFNRAGTALEIQEVILHFAKIFPEHQIISSIDHSLLTKRHDERSDLELQNNLIKTSIDTKAMLGDRLMQIILLQMNSDIEDDNRRTKPALHYPIQADLYMGGQMFQGADNVLVLYSPSKAHIEYYGTTKTPTVVLDSQVKNLIESSVPDLRRKLIHASIIKNRDGDLGQTWFLNDLHKGKITPISREVISKDNHYIFSERPNYLDYIKSKRLGY